MSAAQRAPVPCPRCGQPAPAGLSPGAAVTHGTVAATLERRPTLRCAAGHRAPDPATDLDLVLRACAEQVATAAGGRLRAERCGRCRAPLRMPVRRTTRTVSVADASPLGVLTLHLDIPATRCPDCGLDQVPARSRDDVAAAVRQALLAEPTPS